MRGIVLALAIAAAVAAGGVVSVRAHWLPLPAFLHGKAKPRRVPTIEVGVPQITTNLDGDAADFAQVSLTVGVAGPRLAQAFNAQMPAVENALIGDVRGMSLAQLNGPAGMARLRQEVTASLDQILGSSQAVRHVYFTQFVVQ